MGSFVTRLSESKCDSSAIQQRYIPVKWAFIWCSIVESFYFKTGLNLKSPQNGDAATDGKSQLF
jgi:hypothetical protein